MYGGIGGRIYVFLRRIEEYFSVFAELFTGGKKSNQMILRTGR